MKARSRITPISLAVLAAGAGAYAYAIDRGTISDADRAARRADVFPSFRVEEVGLVDLEHDGESLILERNRDGGASGTSWTMTSPKAEPADGAAVDALLRELDLAKRVREVSGHDAAALGTPRVRGRLVIGALQYRFALGADAPRPNGGAYMHIEGDATFVIGRSLKVQLLRGADAYRERMLVAYGAGEVARIDVSAKTEADAFAIERRKASFYVVGARMRASRDAVDRLFAALADSRIDSFLEDAQADRATAGPAFEVSLTPRDAARPTVHLRIGSECPGLPDDVVVVRDTPTHVAACTARTIVGALKDVRPALADRSPLFAHADEIEELRLETVGDADSRVELGRKERVWHERFPEDRDLREDEAESANALALALADARALDVGPPAPHESFAARARATIVRAGGDEEIVEIGTPSHERIAPVRRLDDGAVLRLPIAMARRFDPHPVALRGPPVWSAPFDPSSVVALDDSCGPTIQRVERHNGTWVLRSPGGFGADAASIYEWIDAVAHEKASAWIAESDDGTFGLSAQGACAVVLTLAGSDARAPLQARIVFGAGTDDGSYAQVGYDSSKPADPRDHAIFAPSPFLRNLVSHLAIDRSRFRIDPRTLVRLTLTRANSRLSLVRVGEALVRTPPSGSTPGEAGANDRDEAGAIATEALAELYPSATLRAGPPEQDEGWATPTLEIRATSSPHRQGDTVETHVTIGARTNNGADTYFARVSGVEATFAVPRHAVTALLGAW